MAFMDEIDLSGDAIKAAAILVVIFAAVVINAIVRLALRFLTRRAVRRALAGRGRWRLLLPRAGETSDFEKRRVQRADAAAHMLSRLTNLVVAMLAAITISHILAIDPVVLISSAGFVGAGIAIGGQALIKDWLTGLLVLLEDRYAIGDQVAMQVGGNEITGTVETLGGAGVRVRLRDGTTWHAGHGSIESVTNLSQQLVPHSVEIPSDVWAQLDQTMIGPRLNAASHDLGLTDVLLVADIQSEQDGEGDATVTFHATRHLNERQRKIVQRRIADGPTD